MSNELFNPYYSKGVSRSTTHPITRTDSETLVNPMDNTMKKVYDSVIARDPNQPEFHQAVEEVLESLVPVIQAHPEYLPVVESMVEAERIIQFRVPWYDDNGKLHVNRGFRIQMNSAIGPYKGGLRFHPSVNQSILKFRYKVNDSQQLHQLAGRNHQALKR